MMTFRLHRRRKVFQKRKNKMKLISENPKASITALAGAIVVVVVFILAQFGIMVPEAVTISLGVIVAALLGYFSRLSKTNAKKLENINAGN